MKVVSTPCVTTDTQRHRELKTPPAPLHLWEGQRVWYIEFGALQLLACTPDLSKRPQNRSKSWHEFFALFAFTNNEKKTTFLAIYSMTSFRIIYNVVCHLLTWETHKRRRRYLRETSRVYSARRHGPENLPGKRRSRTSWSGCGSMPPRTPPTLDTTHTQAHNTTEKEKEKKKANVNAKAKAFHDRSSSALILKSPSLFFAIHLVPGTRCYKLLVWPT